MNLTIRYAVPADTGESDSETIAASTRMTTKPQIFPLSPLVRIMYIMLN